MASENVDDWDEPLPSSPIPSEGDEEEEEVPEDELRRLEEMEKLQQYVAQMAYRPVPPCPAKPNLEKLSQPKKVIIADNLNLHGSVLSPKQRRCRMSRMAASVQGISTEQLEKIIKCERAKDQKKEESTKRKQEIYYDLLGKLEQQCRTQYLNVLIKKFASFVAKLATTMRIPTQLSEPYARMQRALFCNIMLGIGVQPSNPEAIFYTTAAGADYEVCHKLAHALLSLIIKGLDTAVSQDPVDIQSFDDGFEMDNYIKDRLMCAAEKKVQNSRCQAKGSGDSEDPRVQALKTLNAVLMKCKKYTEQNSCV